MLNYIREKRLWPQVQSRSRDYCHALDYQERLAEQLRRFNQVWVDIRSRVPYYQDLTRTRVLPEAFRSWEEIVDSFPVLNRSGVQQFRERLVSRSKVPDWYRITGGSTAQPIQLPAWDSENVETCPDAWLGRSWYGIRPSDRLFLLWGHSHLMGTGWMGYYNRSFRKIKDRLLGYCRFSAYDMSVDKMRAAAQAMVDFRPDYIIGYSVALDSLARYNQDKADVFCHLGLKAVIATAEGFPSDDSADLVSRVIGSPVAMEYGAVETGVIAHSHPEGGYRVFWRTYFLEAQEDAVGGGKKLRVTSLYPRCFPLIRYEIGDEIIPSVGEPEWGVARFDRVIGRCNDYLVLADGSRVHSELITHAVRCCDDILAYQAVQTDSSVRLNVVSQVDLSSETIGAIRARLRTINPLLGAIEVARVSELRRTVAGKTPIIIRKPVLMA